MRLVKIPRAEWDELHARFRKNHYYIARVFVPGTEDHRAVVDEWGNVQGAVSFSIERDQVRVFSLGSRRKGVGTQLMNCIERIAEKRGVPVRLAAERSALGFYLKRGYRKLPFQRSSCRVLFLKKSFTSV